MKETSKNFFVFSEHFRKSLAIICCLLFATSSLMAQNVPLRGSVVDFTTGSPLIGVSVQVPGTTIGTITNLDGEFHISVPAGTTRLQFTYIGYEDLIEAIGNRSVINVRMREDADVLDEVVVVGFGTQRRANLTGAVSSVDVARQIEGRPIPDVGRALQGAVPGLTVTTSSGRIGSAPVLRIRGTEGTLIAGGQASAPLVLLNGVEIADINLVNPDDIESVSVLKDAASSSIFGARAAFGVIMITTRQGDAAKDRVTVRYNNNFSWATPTALPEMAKTYVGAEMAMIANDRRNPGASSYQIAMQGLMINAAAIERMREWDRNFGHYNLSPEMVLDRDFQVIDGQVFFYRSWNPVEMYMRKWTPTTQHNLSVSGSSGSTTVNLSVGYMGQSGVVRLKPDKFDRYSVNMSLGTKANDWLTLRGNFMFSRTTLEEPTTLSNTENITQFSSLYNLYRWPSFMPYGTFQDMDFRNPITEIMASPYNTTQRDMWRFTTGATAQFTRSLSLDVDYTYSGRHNMHIRRGGEVGGWDFWGGSLVQSPNWAHTNQRRMSQQFTRIDYQVLNTVLRYNTLIKQHRIGAFAGVNIEEHTTRWMLGRVGNLLDLNKQEFRLSEDENPFIDGDFTDWSILGFFGRVNYAFADKYLLELNARYDGSSRFPLDQRYGLFPSGSAGWTFSQEEFMEVFQPHLSFGQIRVSYGQIGNQNVGENRFRAILATTNASGTPLLANWIINNINERTFGMPPALRDGFTWETVETMNLGLNLRFLNNRLGVTTDLFQRKTQGLISAGEAVPLTFGASSPLANNGELTSRGWEISVDYRHRFANGLGLSVTANVSDAQTRITKHSNDLRTSVVGVNYTGRILGEIWGFETYGFFKEEDFLRDADGYRLYYNYVDGEKVYGREGQFSAMAPGVPSHERIERESPTWFKLQPGDIRYVDRDGDGEINWFLNQAANPGDMYRIGNTTPRFEYAFRINLDYKNFDLSTFFQGVGSRQFWGTGTMMIPAWNFSELVFFNHQLDYWTPENQNARYPRMSPMSQPGVDARAAAMNFMPQTKYLLNMAYLRLKNVSLGYTLPNSLLQKADISHLRIFVTGENLLTFHHLGDIPLDPETGVATGDGGAMGFGRIYPFTRSYAVGMQLRF